MTTSVKLREEDKARLDRLQAVVTLKAGSKKTQEEILSMLISEALKRGDDFVKEILGTTVPMTDNDYRKLLSMTGDWGVQTPWQDIDRVLYGNNVGPRRRARASS
jgi:hypothetical protein